MSTEHPDVQPGMIDSIASQFSGRDMEGTEPAARRWRSTLLTLTTLMEAISGVDGGVNVGRGSPSMTRLAATAEAPIVVHGYFGSAAWLTILLHVADTQSSWEKRYF